MGKRSQNHADLPLKMVGSTSFGRYPKISIEETYNFIISDEWLVPSSGFKKVLEISRIDQGRGIFASDKYNHLVVVIGNEVFIIDTSFFTKISIGLIDTLVGDVFMSENHKSQIAICDKKDIWIFDYAASTFTKANLGTSFLPGYIDFQNGRFIAPNLLDQTWRLSAIGDGLTWPFDSHSVGTFQTKGDLPQACIRVPGGGNQLLVIGNIVTELWTDVGAQLFPYQRSSAYNIDYGCINQATIAASDKFVIWLAANEKSGPAIMLFGQGGFEQISNDGINFKLASLKHPEKSYGFLFKQDGHLIYQLTFYDAEDNFTYAFDFNTKAFFSFTDEKMNCHVAKRVVYFDNTYYFVSLAGGDLYELNSEYLTYDGEVIPRIRIPPTLRLPDSSPFIANNLTFVIEQGQPNADKYNDVSRIDVSCSYDGGQSFSGNFGVDMNPLAQRKNRVVVWNLGLANELIPQFRFWGTGRFVVGNGALSIYQ